VRVGVVGGGQLARMMVPPAVALGIELHVLSEAPGASARIATTTVGDYRDAATVLAFAREVDVVTFDHEHVPQEVLAELIAAGVTVRPGPGALAVAQDKLLMRERLGAIGAPVPAWARVETEDELAEFLVARGGTAIVKTPRGGYDGKGVRLIRRAADASDWLLAGPLLAEELVDFRRELAQLSARRPGGHALAWPLVQTVQRDGVCAEVTAPAPDMAVGLVDAAAALAELVAVGLDVTGVLAIELFETRDGRLLVNELAMRPHNSGHWTIDGSITSQFEQHLRAVLDLPLGDPSSREPWSVMVNILGGPKEGVPSRYREALAAQPGVKFHSYGKEFRPGRKVGHVTATGADLTDVTVRARAAATALN